MTIYQWPRVRRILEEALDRPAECRHVFVRRACGGDEVLQAEIESLLTLDVSDDTFLEPPIGNAAGQIVLEEHREDEIGTRIGPYRLTHLIASGGMGTVYRASRADAEYDKQVAVKILGGSLQSASATARFQRERQILASLEHPNITRLIDGGTLPDGRSYIVMEYVQGTPLVRHARRLGLSTDQRLELFERVCRTVQFAHQNLVIHRDLKPANILVTDGGEVKLLDFGVSKLMPTGGLGIDAETVTVATPMTLRYSSPEQVSGKAVTTSTDIYSLGVILHELLTETLPYEVGPSLPEAMHAIREVMPPSPSTVRPGLNDELDAIVLHALEKTPSRRYQTAEAFANDIGRFLDGETVLAHPPTRWYRMRKAAWRYRWPLALAATIFLLLSVSVLVVSALSVRLSREKAAAVAAGRRETVARRHAEQINTFLGETLIAADPLRDGKRDLSVLSLLNDASARLAAHHPVDGLARADLHITLGRAYLSLWLVRDAQPHLTAAVNILRRSRSPARLASALALAGKVHTHLFEYTAAEAVYRERLEILQRLGTDPLAVASAKLDLASIARSLGQRDEATDLVEQALAERRAMLGTHVDVAEALDALAGVRARQRDPAAARRLLDEAHAMRVAIFGEQDVAVADGLERAAHTTMLMGELDRAADLFEQALAVHAHVHGPRHPATIDVRLSAAEVELERDDADRAEALTREAVEIAEASLPEWHRTLRYARSFRGLSLADVGRFEEAEPLLLAAMAGTIRLWGAEHQLVRHLCVHLDGIYEQQGSPEEPGPACAHAGEQTLAEYLAEDGEHCTGCGFRLRWSAR
ncbi:MAG: serine/threonine protein kinase [Planctomycetota bacterium]|jgi:serine/threonine-protein kinase